MSGNHIERRRGIVIPPLRGVQRNAVDSRSLLVKSFVSSLMKIYESEIFTRKLSNNEHYNIDFLRRSPHALHNLGIDCFIRLVRI